MATTALFAEFLVIGASGWLWLVPILFLVGTTQPAFLIPWASTLSSPEIAAAVLLTYVLGIVTDSFAAMVEGAITLTWGTRPRPWSWFTRLMRSSPSPDEWRLAQLQIWNSEPAFKEFIYDRLRLKIGRGLCFNAVLGAVLWGCYASGPATESLMPMVCIVSSLGGFVTWLAASREYYGRVAALAPRPEGQH